MSGIEILGIAAAVLQIAELGGKLSVKLFTFSRKVKNAHSSINSISKDIAATGAILQQLSSVLKKDEDLRLCSQEAIDTARSLVSDCRKIFTDLDEALGTDPSSNKYITSLRDRLRYPFLEPHIDLLQSNLERLKSSLVVILNVLIFAEQLRSQEALPILQEQRTLLKILVADRNSSWKSYQQKQKLIDHQNSPKQQLGSNAPTSPPIILNDISTNARDPPRATSFGRDQEIEHHGNLVELLVKEINHPQHKVNHGIRYRLNQSVLKTHWAEWSPLRKLYGDARIMQCIANDSELARYWLSEMDEEAITDIRRRLESRPPMYTPDVRHHLPLSSDPQDSPVEGNQYGFRNFATDSPRNKNAACLSPSSPTAASTSPSQGVTDTQRKLSARKRYFQQRDKGMTGDRSTIQKTAADTIADFDNTSSSVEQKKMMPKKRATDNSTLRFDEGNIPLEAQPGHKIDEIDDGDSDDDLFSFPLSTLPSSHRSAKIMPAKRPSLHLADPITHRTRVAFDTDYQDTDKEYPQASASTFASSSDHCSLLFNGTTWARRSRTRKISKSLDQLFSADILDQPSRVPRSADGLQTSGLVSTSVMQDLKLHTGMTSKFKTVRQAAQDYALMNEVNGHAERNVVCVPGIAKGRHGSVCLGLDLFNGRILAIKQFNKQGLKENAERGDTEKAIHEQAIKRLVFLKHINIVQYLHCEHGRLTVDLHLEYVSGGSVGTCLRSYGKMDESLVKSFVHQVTSGLVYLHDEGVVAGNLRADKILLNLDGQCKISDYGIDKQLRHLLGMNTEKDADDSVFWLAPEAVSTERGKSFESDVWSLGCLTLEMLDGKRAWGREEAIGAVYKLGSLNQAPPISDEVLTITSPEALAFMYDCFTIDVSDRPTARALVQHAPFCEADPLFNWYDTALYKKVQLQDSKYNHPALYEVKMPRETHSTSIYHELEAKDAFVPVHAQSHETISPSTPHPTLRPMAEATFPSSSFEHFETQSERQPIRSQSFNDELSLLQNVIMEDDIDELLMEWTTLSTHEVMDAR